MRAKQNWLFPDAEKKVSDYLLIILLYYPLLLNKIQAIMYFEDAIRKFDDACGRFLFSFTSKNAALISIEKRDDNRNDNRHKHPIRITYSTQQI